MVRGRESRAPRRVLELNGEPRVIETEQLTVVFDSLSYTLSRARSERNKVATLVGSPGVHLDRIVVHLLR